MSQENVEVVRQMFDAFSRGDTPAMLKLADPSLVFTPLPDAPDVQSFHGHEGLLQGIAQTTEIWDDFSVELREMRDFDDQVLASQQWREDTFDVIEDWRLELDDVVTGDDPDLMVTFQRFVGRARHTDLEVDFPLAVVVRFRAGLISRLDGYRRRREALEAAGLSE